MRSGNIPGYRPDRLGVVDRLRREAVARFGPAGTADAAGQPAGNEPGGVDASAGPHPGDGGEGSAALSKPLQPKDEEELGKLRLQLLNAGFRGENDVQIYLGIKFGCLLIALGVAVPLIYARFGFTTTGFQFMGVAAGVGFYLPGVVVSRIRKKRMEGIFLGLPDALDLMVVCVEAGLGLDSAMRRVAAELAEASPELCEELAIANFQLQMGRAQGRAA